VSNVEVKPNSVLARAFDYTARHGNQGRVPGYAPEKGLLRKSLLDEFVEKRPKTRDDWFRGVPQHVRTSVASRQVGKNSTVCWKS
jgi:hypothetical protein